MAISRGMSVFVNEGTEYAVNDPNTADEFVSGSYAKGAYVFHEGKLYRFTANHTGSWSGSDVTRALVGDELIAAKAEAEALNEKTMAAVCDIVPKAQWRNGSMFNVGNTDAIATDNIIPTENVNKITVMASFPLETGYKYGFEYSTFSVSEGSAVSESSNTIRRNVYVLNETGILELSIRKEEKGFALTMYEDTGSVVYPLRVETTDTKMIRIYKAGEETEKLFSLIEKKTIDNIVPFAEWRNGSEFNPSNDSSIATNTIIHANDADGMLMIASFELQTGYKYGFQFSTFDVSEGNTEAMTAHTIRRTVYTLSESGVMKIKLYPGEKGFAMSMWEEDGNGNYYPLRITNVPEGSINIYRIYSEDAEEGNEEAVPDIAQSNARHVTSNSSYHPLTLLHFSDIHKDKAALKRIIGQAETYTSEIDDIICTGDMAENASEQIESWWDEKVLTVIGNHDTASYSGGTYDWTALSMADRAAYYITPFESNWGIVRTSGKSYYYKDYDAAKVRMIVMDVMAYNDPSSSDATEQTAWLGNVMDAAKLLNYHVLIAIHTAHGGATSINCSFSGLKWTTMPVYQDCNTPQTIIDLVADKITAGVVFIGYIVGHFHQDVIWDAEGDGKQLMYCVTCAAVQQKPQWIGSDQYRSDKADAYNLFTVDTVNHLVKIVRGGGANIDCYMRTREAICIDYTTGTVIGEKK